MNLYFACIILYSKKILFWCVWLFSFCVFNLCSFGGWLVSMIFWLSFLLPVYYVVMYGLGPCCVSFNLYKKIYSGLLFFNRSLCLMEVFFSVSFRVLLRMLYLICARCLLCLLISTVGSCLSAAVGYCLFKFRLFLYSRIARRSCVLWVPECFLLFLVCFSLTVFCGDFFPLLFDLILFLLVSCGCIIFVMFMELAIIGCLVESPYFF